MTEKSDLIKYWFLGIVILTSGIVAMAAGRDHPAVNSEYSNRVRPETVINLRDAKVRQQHVDSLANKARQAKEAAWREAQKRGWKVKGTVEGKSYELIAIEHGRPVYKMTCNADAAISTGANILHGVPLFLDGTGLTVGLWDAGDVRATHQEFDGRVTVIDNAGPHWHSTHVAGTIGAQGVVAAAKGMAPAVNIDSYDWDFDTAEMSSRAASYPTEPGMIYLSNHSYGLIAGWITGVWSDPYWFGVWGEPEDRTFGRYGFYAANWDLVCYSAPYYLPFKAASNDRNDSEPANGETFWYFDPNSGSWQWKLYDDATDPRDDGWPDGYDTIPIIGCAKNIMTVGAVYDAVTGGQRDPSVAWMTSFSCWGPTDDGRIKPDIVANGIGLYSCDADHNSDYTSASGTSMASPSAAGSAALLVQYYSELFAGDAMRASTLKGLIIHTATDLGNPGPDYSYGWGLMDVNLAADYIKDDYENPDRIIEGVLTVDTSNTYTFTSGGINPIRATLCWTDPPGTQVRGLDVNTPRLVNDLDLRIIGPNGLTTYYPYVLDPYNPAVVATQGDNIVDNVEQVYIDLPAAGTYTVQISHKGTLTNGSQHYSLILSEPIPTDFIYVDDDAPDDPVPGISDEFVGGPVSDPNEDGSFEHPYDSIQKAIDDRADDGDIIIVRNGTYTGIGNYDIDPKGMAITVKSDSGPESCEINCESNGRAFLFQSGETTTTVLDGFTIINGYAEDPNWPQDSNDDANGYGGAIYCKQSSPQIKDCIITDNIADSGGGAIFCDVNSNTMITACDISFNFCGNGFYEYGLDVNNVNDINQPGGAIYCRSASPTIDNCTISWNQAAGSGGGIACEDSNAVIMSCNVSYNDCWVDDDDIIQHGGGIYCDGGSPIITKCIITGNTAKWSGGGIAVFSSNDANDVNDVNNIVWIDNCAITDNDCWASGGGIYIEGDSDFNAPNDPNISNIPNCYIKNCLIANNWGYWSGGVSSSYGGFTDINNCTIANNIASYSYLTNLIGGLECYFGDANITNSIIWGNTGDQIAGVRGVNDVTYSDIQLLDSNDPNAFDIWPGEGNINADPLFANPIRRDYHLQTEYPDGRWNPKTGLFDVNDPNTSPCINAGDPFSDYSLEPAPNGDRINMGAYGNTLQASKSDIIRPVPPNITGGMSVNLVDFALLADNWLLERAAIKNHRADFDNNGIVDEYDLFILGKFWLWQPEKHWQYYH